MIKKKEFANSQDVMNRYPPRFYGAKVGNTAKFSHEYHTKHAFC